MEKSLKNIRSFYTIVDTQEQAYAAKKALVKVGEPVWAKDLAFKTEDEKEDKYNTLGFMDSNEWFVVPAENVPRETLYLPYEEFMAILEEGVPKMISQEAAEELLKLDNQELKNFAISLYPSLKKFSLEDYTTFDHILSYHNLTHEEFYKNTDQLTDPEIAFRELCLIASALNNGEKIDMQNTDQKKWYAWWTYKGGGFSLFYVYHLYSSSYVPPPSLYVSEEAINHSVKHFKEYWKRWLTN